MADKCKKCEMDIEKSKEGIKCTDCSAVFHPQCSGVTGESSRKNATRKNWKCDSCAVETLASGSRTSNERDTSASSVLEAIAAFRKESNDRWDQSIIKLDKMQSDIKEVSTEVCSLKIQLLEIKADCDSATKSVGDLKAESRRLNEELSVVKLELADLQQHTRKNNILISGVPVSTSEDVYAVLNNIAGLLELNFYRSDISVAHRLSSRPGDNRPPSIVVSFVSRSVKTDWLNARKRKRRLSARELLQSWPDHQVYLNEHLTLQTREIFNGVRELVKAKVLASAWTNDGRVFAKKTLESRPFRVQNRQQIEDLK